MYIDITTRITLKMIKGTQGNEMRALIGHLGAHFDVMNKEFPLECLKRIAVIFDVRSVRERDINVKDIDLDQIQEQMFVIFHTIFIKDEGYGTEKYFKEHLQLSGRLIDVLLEKKVLMIGIDFARVRRGKGHTLKNQYCTGRGVFIIEDPCNLGEALRDEAQVKIAAYTFPVNYAEMTGLPYRVVLKVQMLSEGYRELPDRFVEYLEKQEMPSRLTEADSLHGYDCAEIHCIGMIEEIEGPTASKITERMKMTRSAISEMTKRQVKAKLVEKYSLDTNKREVYFRLTETGWKLCREHGSRHRLWEQRDMGFFQHHSAEELNRVLQLMKEFNQYLRVQIDKVSSQQVIG